VAAVSHGQDDRDVHRRLYTPRQRRADRRRQLLRDILLGVAFVTLAQILVPLLPAVRDLGIDPVPPAFVAAVDPARGR